MKQELMPYSREELLKRAKSINGHHVSEYNINNRDYFSNKGVIGQIVEEGVFGLKVNSRAEPDFKPLGIELKVTGLKKLKRNDYVAKERLVLNLINFEAEKNSTFEISSFWEKNQELLLMFYLYEEDAVTYDFEFVDSILYNYSPEDLEIIKNDWEIIHTKIINGEAHLISEADTMYLAACTKGATSESSFRSQPFSHIKAKQRAYCLKPSFVNQIIRENLINEKCKRIFELKDLRKKTFEQLIEEKISAYFGKSEKELRSLLGIITNAKNRYERYIAAILGISGNIKETDEFKKANIILKTIRIQKNNKIKESMSFPAFQFEQLSKETWDDSELRNLFYSSKFMFVIYEEKANNEYFLTRVKFWNMPLSQIDTKVYEVWKKTQEIILLGNIVNKVKETKNGKKVIYNNFPGMTFNHVCHVRPHGKNSLDVFQLPTQDILTGRKNFPRQCFWLDNSYVSKII